MAKSGKALAALRSRHGLPFCRSLYALEVFFDAGIHAPGAGSGVYFIVLSTPERTVARAMHLLR